MDRTTTPHCHAPGDVDPDIWYSDARRKQSQARALCAACPLQQQCLRQALVEDEDWGIWGGLTAEERDTLKERLSSRGLRASAAAAA